MTWPRATVGMAMFLLLATIGERRHVSVTTAEGGQAPMVQSRLIGYQVAFQFTQSPRQTALRRPIARVDDEPATDDQITVIFANRSVEGPRPPRPFFGDTHLHTSFSMDAGAFGCRLGARDAYRFATEDRLKFARICT